ncbi:MAG: Amidase [Frankiales bacterium]|nr:Amidase [Frankiales bacterium]
MTATTSKSTATAISAAPDGLPLTITAAAEALRDGTFTSVSLTQAVQARSDTLDPLLGTYISRLDEAALDAAAAADAELAAGVDRGLLHGIPLGIKDIIATREGPSTAQSLILDPGFGTGPDGDRYDAVVVQRLRAAGAVLTGKTTTTEYAIGMPDESKGFPTPHNAYDLDFWPGGSSSGTGNGVASGQFLGGLGTDTGGSIRMPAAWSNLSGMKQTFGRVPKSGCVPLGFSYDHIGPLTRSARDAAAMLAVLAGHDESDACSVNRPVDDYVGALTGSMAGLKVGVDLSFLDWAACDPDVAGLTRDAVAVFKDAGAIVTEVKLPLWQELCTATMCGLVIEGMAYHRGDFRSRWNDYGRPTRLSIGQGMFMTAADFVQAQRVRRVGVRAVTELFGQYDLLITPTTLVPPLPVDNLDFGDLIASILTPYWNATGNPAMSIPMGLTSGGLPVGLQLAAKPFDEATIFQAADAFQLLTDHHLVESAAILELLS